MLRAVGEAACCDVSAAGGSCGCAAGQTTDPDALRETVRERYAKAARSTSDPTAAAGCCSDDAVITDEQAAVFGSGLYAADERDELPDIEITETHRVHEHAGSAIIRARKPA